MNAAELRALLDRALGHWEGSADELRDLDAAVGDGDLGITVSKGARAVREGLSQLDASATPTDVLRSAALHFGSANPSTFAALTATALLAAADAVGGATDLGTRQVIAMGQAASGAIIARGRAAPGDKTILDALIPSIAALTDASPDRPALDQMITAAREGIDSTTPLVSRRGRAAWTGERSAHHQDPGAIAYLRLLEAVGKTFASIS